MNPMMKKADAIATNSIPGLTHALRAELLQGVSLIPRDLKQFKGWLCWRVTSLNPTTGKFSKFPFYPTSGEARKGEQGSPEDLQNLGTFEDAMAKLEVDPNLAGIGFAILEQFGIVALDVDKCVEAGVLRPEVAALTEGTYCEISPSGTGIRAFWKGTAKNGKNGENGFELYAKDQFMTVTGNRRGNFHSLFSDGTLPTLDMEMRNRLETLSHATGGSERGSSGSQLQESAKRDPKLKALDDARLYECELRNGKHSIRCPFEHEHSDPERKGGDGDTVYFQPHTNGYERGHIHCHHAHCADRMQREFWQAVGFDEDAYSTVGLFAPINDSDWPDPIPLPGLPPVPAFDPSLLPDAVRPWVADVAERLQMPPDVPAIGTVAALSSAIGRRVQIRPKQNDSWTVIPNLWGMVVAPPGYMKSPALSEVMRPLHTLEKRANEEHLQALAAWELEKERIALVNSATKSVALGKLKKDALAETPSMLAQPDEPIPKRYVVNNFTLEALGEVMIGNENGVLAFADELYGLLKMADKPGNEELQNFLLSAWNGEGSFTFDRIIRGQRYVPNLCISVLGGIQPGRLVDYLTNGGRSGGAVDSGFLNRFQLLAWPDLERGWKLIDRLPDLVAQETYHRVFERVTGTSLFPNLEDASTPSNEPDVRRFDAEAQAVFYEWMEQNERLIRGDSLPPVMASHLSKFRSLVPSLALIFAVADEVRGHIPVQYVRQAIGWADYLRAHAERVFACTTRPETTSASALLRKIRDGVLTDPFTAREVYRNEWSLLSDRSAVEKATELLCDYDHLHRVETPSSSKGGRPSVAFRINPKTRS